MSPNREHPQRFDPSAIETAVSPMLLQPLPSHTYSLLARYLQLLTHWNQKMNLTAVCDPDVLARLHLGECLRAAQRIPAGVKTVLDFGSGAGFPGIPMQIVRPELEVTLAESQKKKAAFLREAVRELNLSRSTIYSGRVEDMPKPSVFDMVALRAVDNMDEAVRAGVTRVRPFQGDCSGWCMVLTSRPKLSRVTSSLLPAAGMVNIEWKAPDPIPGTDQRVILLGFRVL